MTYNVFGRTLNLAHSISNQPTTKTERLGITVLIKSVYLCLYATAVRCFVVQEILNPLVTYHRFISFSLYVAGLCGFVFSLRKKNYLKQFTMVRNYANV